MSATFLEVRGRPCALFGVLVGVGEPGEPEKKRARGRSCLALDLLRHGLGGYVFFTSVACFRCVFYNDFGVLLWIWAISGARRAAGGAPRREMTRKRQPKAQKWAPFWDGFGSWSVILQHVFSCVFLLCFL